MGVELFIEIIPTSRLTHKIISFKDPTLPFLNRTGKQFKIRGSTRDDAILSHHRHAAELQFYLHLFIYLIFKAQAASAGEINQSGAFLTETHY